MTRIKVASSISIAAPRHEVFCFVADWRNAPRYVPNLMRVNQAGDVSRGVGTIVRGRALLDLPIKGLQIDSASEVVEMIDDERIVCRSVAGITSSNVWIFADHGTGTDATAVVSYHLPHDLPGKLLGRAIARRVAGSVETMLANLKREIEKSDAG